MSKLGLIFRECVFSVIELVLITLNKKCRTDSDFFDILRMDVHGRSAKQGQAYQQCVSAVRVLPYLPLKTP